MKYYRLQICTGLLSVFAGSQLTWGQVTPITAHRTVGIRAYVSAPPDYYNYGGSNSNSTDGLERWNDGYSLGPGVGSAQGDASAVAIATHYSEFQPARIQTILSARSESYTHGSGYADVSADSTLALRFSLSARSIVDITGTGSNNSASFTCTLRNGSDVVFAPSNPSYFRELTLAPGTYDLAIEIHCNAVTSGSGVHIEQCESDVDMQFSPAPCAADFNGDATVDFFDYLDFVDAFSGGAAAADFNHDSVIDFFDYLDFVDAFSGGC